MMSSSGIRKLSFQQYSRCISPLSRLHSKYIHAQDPRFVVKSNSFIPRRYFSMKGKKYIYAHKFEGMPKVTDLQLAEEEILPIKDGGI